MTTCITPGCTGTADHTLRCRGCNDNLVTYSALGWTKPWNEDPSRQWRPGDRASGGWSGGRQLKKGTNMIPLTPLHDLWELAQASRMGERELHDLAQARFGKQADALDSGEAEILIGYILRNNGFARAINGVVMRRIARARGAGIE